jgi:tetratricopeptide (TPR) repeat protein
MFAKREVARRTRTDRPYVTSSPSFRAVLWSSDVTLDSGSRRPLPHLAYLEALADCEESSPRWHALTAGYAALQLFDLWVEHERGAIPPSDLELRRVHRRLALVATGDPVRRCLTHLLELMERAAPVRGSKEHRLRSDEAGRILAAYGKLLQYESSWSLSLDVHETLIFHAWRADDEDRLLDSMLMVAFCHRTLGQLDEARQAYTVLRETAAEVRSEQYLLLSELGFAKIAVARGNLPAAAGMLDRILKESHAAEHSSVRAKALMDRARVAMQLGDNSTALVLGHQAFECSTDPFDRDRLLLNIGLTLSHMGLRSEARDAYLVAATTAQEATVRWMAQINLMELAYLDGNELQFEHYQRAVPAGELPPYVETVYYETRAHGHCVFGRLDQATDAFNRMLDVASRHGLNEFVIKADIALSDVARVTPPLARVPHEDVQASTAIGEVTQSLSRLREHAGI